MILELVLIRLFCNGQQPSVCVQAKQDGRWKDSWDEAIWKAIIAEAKATLNLPS